jgi:hypothetical protein
MTHAAAMPDAPPPIIKISVFNSMPEPPVVILLPALLLKIHQLIAI